MSHALTWQHCIHVVLAFSAPGPPCQLLVCCSIHVASVVQMTHMLLCHGGVLKSQAMDALEHFSSYWSAAIHDYGAYSFAPCSLPTLQTDSLHTDSSHTDRLHSHVAMPSDTACNACNRTASVVKHPLLSTSLLCIASRLGYICCAAF